MCRLEHWEGTSYWGFEKLTWTCGVCALDLDLRNGGVTV